MASSGAPTTLVSMTVSGPGIPAFAAQVARDLTAEPPTEAIDDAPYSFGYTGKHDGGLLPPARVDNVYGHVLAALLDAKAQTDVFLRGLPSTAPAAVAAAGAAASPARKARGGGPAAKKRRVGDGDSAALGESPADAVEGGEGHDEEEAGDAGDMALDDTPLVTGPAPEAPVAASIGGVGSGGAAGGIGSTMPPQ
jgi:hypothetical protein